MRFKINKLFKHYKITIPLIVFVFIVAGFGFYVFLTKSESLEGYFGGSTNAATSCLSEQIICGDNGVLSVDFSWTPFTNTDLWAIHPTYSRCVNDPIYGGCNWENFPSSLVSVSYSIFLTYVNLQTLQIVNESKTDILGTSYRWENLPPAETVYTWYVRVHYHYSMYGDSADSVLQPSSVFAPATAPGCNPTIDIKANGSDGPITIPYNTAANLSWTSTNAVSCYTYGCTSWSSKDGSCLQYGNIGKPVNGSETTGLLTYGTTYSMTCTSPYSKTATDSVRVEVNTSPILTLTANPSAIVSGGSTTLNWSLTQYAPDIYDYNCDASASPANAQWTGAKNPAWTYDYTTGTRTKSGTQLVTNLTQTTDFILTCTQPNTYLVLTRTARVAVGNPTTLTFTANPTTIEPYQSSTLTWTTTYANSCTASASTGNTQWTGAKNTSGTQTITMIPQSTVFTLICTGDMNSVTKDATVNVNTPPNNPPTANTLTKTDPDFCSSSFQYIMSWVFSDPDPGDQQLAKQVQVSSDGFSTIKYDSGKVYNSTNSLTINNLDYNTPYSWRLKVWDSHDLSSAWINSSSTFTTIPGAYPTPDFTWDILSPGVGEDVQFTGTASSFVRTWRWEFEDGTPEGPGNQNPKAHFNSVGNKTVLLSVLGTTADYYCSTSKEVNVASSSYKWKEIPPW